jgi:NADH-quinone oxidoreductase subunit N
MIRIDTIRFLMPEIMLVITAAWIYVAGAFIPTRRAMIWHALVGLAMAGYFLFMQRNQASVMYLQGAGTLSLGPIGFELFGYLTRCLGLLVAVLFVATAAGADRDGPQPEALGSLLLVNVGLMLVAASSELILLFLGLELISIPTYVLLFLARRDTPSHEATLKYFFLSILSSALLLYGFSFLYGVAGSTRLSEIYAAASGPSGSQLFASLAPLALVLIVAGLSFKIAAVPFHFYAPDVYQGTSNLNAGVLAVVPKIAGIVALVKIGSAMMPLVAGHGWQLFLILAVLTMTLGNVVALWQKNFRRLLAYSSIAHAGYMLIGLAVWMAAGAAQGVDTTVGVAGLSATLLYVVVYAAASLGTFAALVYLGRSDRQIDTVDELGGLSRTYRGAALMIAIFMFSLAGLPPLAGFWGKLGLFASALNVRSAEPGLLGTASLQTWFLILAVVGVLNAAVSAAYYLRIVAAMYFGSSTRAPSAKGGLGAALATGFCTAIVLGVGLYPGPLVQGTQIGGQAAATQAADSTVPARVGQR